MRIFVKTRHVRVGGPLVGFIQTALTQRLQRFSAAVASASVHLSDRNGRRGGSDKQCQIVVSLRDGGQISGVDSRANLLFAVRRTISQVESAVRRRVKAVVPVREESPHDYA